MIAGNFNNYQDYASATDAMDWNSRRFEERYQEELQNEENEWELRMHQEQMQNYDFERGDVKY